MLRVLRTMSLPMALLALAGCGDGGGGGADAPPLQSPGCESPELAAGSHMLTLDHGGRTRELTVYVPATVDGAAPTPLVLNFHGFGSDAFQQRAFSEMDATADAEGFIVVYPNGVQNSWNGGTCCGTAASEEVDDVGFAVAIAEELGRLACIDERRVYATGMSNGGFMSHRLACEASDTFAAVGPVAGVLGIPECNPTRPMPIVHFHGTADPLVPYEGEGVVNSESVPEMMGGWAERNGCNPEPSETFRNGDAHCDTWSGCDAGVETTLCTIDGMGHCWPGSEFGADICPTLSFGPGSLDISANQRMWELFEQHSLP